MNLSECLKKLRKSFGYKQEYVASQINVQRQSYSAYETGLTIPPASRIKSLANLYHVPVSFFMDALPNSDTAEFSNEFSKDLNDMNSKNSELKQFIQYTEKKADALKYLSPQEKWFLFYLSNLDVHDREDILSYSTFKFHAKHNRKKNFYV